MGSSRKVIVGADDRGDPIGWAPVTGAAAFFDVDNTMMRGASLYWFARGLAARDYFRPGDLARFAWQQLRFRLLATEHAGDMSRARETALAFVAGWRVDEIERLTWEIFDELIEPRIWAGARALAQQHLEYGQQVWLVSAAPVEIGRAIAARLGLSGAIGTVAEVRDGAYTGRLVGDLMHGAAKAAAVRRLAEVEGLDLARCTAYSDSSNDIPMLSAVGQAVAVNPDAALLRVARERGWPVRDFRTGRRAVKIAVPSTVAAGALAGAGLALRRHFAR
ncbi:HAD family hydrolase [Plantactinospora siamensis]|uniref:HAD family hydrolase n=1 Tax=Plantactinospora siamensis TaxID=555372 RepID=A0ABV6P7V9_9ACTN